MIVKFKGKYCELIYSKYSVNKATALLLMHEGEKVVMCTSNIKDNKLGRNEVAIKNYSENEGVFEALIEAGAIEDTGKVIKLDYNTHSVIFPIGKLLIK